MTVDRFLEHVRASDSSLRLFVRHSRVLRVLNMLFLQRENWGQQLDSPYISLRNQLCTDQCLSQQISPLTDFVIV